ncbi:hypothetical protein D0T53_07415 [Dysgonomonas sp. 216]|uniref:hypothetical protein n=1 Tax=Dysgonomonas sp. 216 TaxID=2302934 RepID=UPI0013D32315|nr:hypothetical protein [Dysgonomonas sp. 216]NDW18741.1 hypothetical protein [Dysgonomonas sp. 216]
MSVYFIKNRPEPAQSTVQILDATQREAVAAVVTVSRIYRTTVEVQVVGISTKDITAPVVAVRTLVVEQTITVVPVATSGQKKANTKKNLNSGGIHFHPVVIFV